MASNSEYLSIDYIHNYFNCDVDLINSSVALVGLGP